MNESLKITHLLERPSTANMNFKTCNEFCFGMSNFVDKLKNYAAIVDSTQLKVVVESMCELISADIQRFGKDIVTQTAKVKRSYNRASDTLVGADDTAPNQALLIQEMSEYADTLNTQLAAPDIPVEVVVVNEGKINVVPPQAPVLQKQIPNEDCPPKKRRRPKLPTIKPKDPIKLARRRKVNLPPLLISPPRGGDEETQHTNPIAAKKGIEVGSKEHIKMSEIVNTQQNLDFNILLEGLSSGENHRV